MGVMRVVVGRGVGIVWEIFKERRRESYSM